MSFQVRDISVDLSNSCNCIPRRNPIMCIDNTGRAVRYDRTVYPDLERSMQLSMDNLQLLILANAAAFGREYDALKADLEARVEMTLDAHPPPRITLRLIEKINTAIKDILQRGVNENA